MRQQLRGWQADGIARALHAVAEADAQVKGEATSAAYALERAIRRDRGRPRRLRASGGPRGEPGRHTREAERTS